MHLTAIDMLFHEMDSKVELWGKNLKLDDNGLLSNIMFRKDSWAMAKIYKLCLAKIT